MEVTAETSLLSRRVLHPLSVNDPPYEAFKNVGKSDFRVLPKSKPISFGEAVFRNCRYSSPVRPHIDCLQDSGISLNGSKKKRLKKSSKTSVKNMNCVQQNIAEEITHTSKCDFLLSTCHSVDRSASHSSALQARQTDDEGFVDVPIEETHFNLNTNDTPFESGSSDQTRPDSTSDATLHFGRAEMPRLWTTGIQPVCEASTDQTTTSPVCVDRVTDKDDMEEEGTDLLHLISHSLDRFNALVHPNDLSHTTSGLGTSDADWLSIGSLDDVGYTGSSLTAHFNEGTSQSLRTEFTHQSTSCPNRVAPPDIIRSAATTKHTTDATTSSLSHRDTAILTASDEYTDDITLLHNTPDSQAQHTWWLQYFTSSPTSLASFLFGSTPTQSKVTDPKTLTIKGTPLSHQSPHSDWLDVFYGLRSNEMPASHSTALSEVLHPHGCTMDNDVIRDTALSTQQEHYHLHHPNWDTSAQCLENLSSSHTPSRLQNPVFGMHLPPSDVMERKLPHSSSDNSCHFIIPSASTLERSTIETAGTMSHLTHEFCQSLQLTSSLTPPGSYFHPNVSLSSPTTTPHVSYVTSCASLPETPGARGQPFHRPFRHHAPVSRHTTGIAHSGHTSSSPPTHTDGTGRPIIAKWRRACSFYLRGHCKKEDCEFAHDLTKVTCKFWEMGECFKGSTCPFLHGYPPEFDTPPND